MATRHEGGCHCGKVRYSFSDDPELTFYCHCSDCQKTTGNPFSVELMVRSGSWRVDGKMKAYTVIGDSGKRVHRRFCPECGSGVYLEGDADPGYAFLKVGTIDDATWVKPDMHIYTGAKQPWIELRDELPRYEKAPAE